jgi:hypothetical protein
MKSTDMDRGWTAVDWEWTEVLKLVPEDAPEDTTVEENKQGVLS